MFEKEAKKWVKEHTETDYKASYGEFPIEPSATKSFKAGAVFGYNKANEWNFVKDGLPPKSGKYLVYTGGDPFTLDFDSETGAFGYWRLDVSDDYGIRDTTFVTVAELNEDEVIAWKEIVLPELPKE